MALLLILCALPGSAYSATLPAIEQTPESLEDPDAKVTALQKEIQLLRAEFSVTEEELSPLKEQVKGVLQQKKLIDQQIALLTREVACYEEILTIYDDQISVKESEYTALSESYAIHFQVLAERLRQSYEEGMPGFLELLSQSDSLSAFLTALERQSEIEAYDRSLMEVLETEQGSLSVVRTVLEKLRSKRHQVAAEQVTRIQLLNTRLQESGGYLQTLENDIDRFSYYIQQIQAGSQLAERQILEAQEAFWEKLEEQGDGMLVIEKEERLALLSEMLCGNMEAGLLQKGAEFYPDGAEYIWPLQSEAGYTATIAAGFGYRTYQVSGKVITDYHSGVDLSASYGTAVVAAASGKVLATGWMEEYGYYVVIWHENGSQTRYGHLSEIAVEVGDYVLQGEPIAAAGCTGNSTGIGCHFELRIDGAATDPSEYLILPEMPVTNFAG